MIVPDITGYEGQTVKIEAGQVWGPATAPIMAIAAAAAREAQNLVVIGEPGSGKRTIADVYLAHREGPRLDLEGGATPVPKTLPKGTATLVLDHAQALSTADQTALARAARRRRARSGW